jgi:tRNA nucleotidyltransferase (CCA-adding enzyme)
VFVSPDDPIEKLQEVMTKTGWGQIPVVDPSKNVVIGIATRTDLLKTLRLGEASLPGHINLSHKLETSLPVTRIALIQVIKAAAEENHLPIYIVGGFVRDLILDQPGEDFDIVVEGDAISLARTLSGKYGGRVVSHRRFGTAKWQIKEIAADLLLQFGDIKGFNSDDLPDTLDFIGARTEFYDYPTALPTVERSSIKLDLHRRDFTINTMALRLDGHHNGELYDFWGGLTDLKQKQVRVLHSLSFVDDPTRMLRAVRFEQRFHFHIETRTLQLISEAKDLLNQVSGDRIRHEFKLIFREKSPPDVFLRLESLGLLEAILPGLHWSNKQSEDWKNLFPAPVKETNSKSNINNELYWQEYCWLGLLIRLDPAGLEAACLRFKIRTGTIKVLMNAQKLQNRLNTLSEMSISQVVKFLDTIPEPAILAISEIDANSPGAAILRKYQEIWKNLHPTVNGRILEQMGIPRGPNYRLILDSLRGAWLNGEIKSQVEEEKYLQQILGKL